MLKHIYFRHLKHYKYCNCNNFDGFFMLQNLRNYAKIIISSGGTFYLRHG